MNRLRVREPRALDENLTPDTVERYKHHDCRSYAACLDEAVRENWHQFHCRACGAYEALPADDPSNQVLARLARALAKY